MRQPRTPPVAVGAVMAKRDLGGTVRGREPADTLALVRPLFPALGITRVANVTGLDRIGIPVWICIRLTGFYPRLRQRLERGAASSDSGRPALGGGFAEMLRSHCAGLGEPVPFDVEAYARSLDFPDGQTGLRLALTGLEAAPTRRRS